MRFPTRPSARTFVLRGPLFLVGWSSTSQPPLDQKFRYLQRPKVIGILTPPADL